jgi:ERCC4-type nuclease
MGFRSAEDIAKAEVADLVVAKGISERKAEGLIQEAINYLQSLELDKEKARDEKKEGLSGGLDG